MEISISQLNNLEVSNKPVKLVYSEGPLHFDEWLSKAIKVFTNITEIDCKNNQLTSLSVPIKVILDCSYNELISLHAPKVTYIDCSFNLLTSLTSEADYVYCSRNKLTKLDVNCREELDCSYNNLSYLVSIAQTIKCNNNQLEYILAPDATKIICYSNQLDKICAPKLLYLSYDIYKDDGKPIDVVPRRDIQMSDKYHPLPKKLISNLYTLKSSIDQ
jgi:hypothetical protein